MSHKLAKSKNWVGKFKISGTFWGTLERSKWVEGAKIQYYVDRYRHSCSTVQGTSMKLTFQKYEQSLPIFLPNFTKFLVNFAQSSTNFTNISSIFLSELFSIEIFLPIPRCAATMTVNRVRRLKSTIFADSRMSKLVPKFHSIINWESLETECQISEKKLNFTRQKDDLNSRDGFEVSLAPNAAIGNISTNAIPYLCRNEDLRDKNVNEGTRRGDTIVQLVELSTHVTGSTAFFYVKTPTALHRVMYRL